MVEARVVGATLLFQYARSKDARHTAAFASRPAVLSFTAPLPNRLSPTGVTFLGRSAPAAAGTNEATQKARRAWMGWEQARDSSARWI